MHNSLSVHDSQDMTTTLTIGCAPCSWTVYSLCVPVAVCLLLQTARRRMRLDIFPLLVAVKVGVDVNT